LEVKAAQADEKPPLSNENTNRGVVSRGQICTPDLKNSLDLHLHIIDLSAADVFD